MGFAGRALRSWVAAILVAAVAGCGVPADRNGAAPADRPHVLLIAADGLEWSVILPLLGEGRMPELARLMDSGTYGLLRSTRPTLSPRIWATVATGKTAEKHGILGFVLWDEESADGERLYRSYDRRAEAFWNILSDHDLRTHVIGWWTTFPVEDIRGVMVAQTNTASRRQVQAGEGIHKGALVPGLSGQVHPPSREGEILRVFERVDGAVPYLVMERLGIDEDRGSEQARSLFEACRWAFRADVTYATVARRISAEGPPYDLMAVYFGGADVVGHRFWRYYEPGLFTHKPGDEDVATFGAVIPAYYAFLDEEIGRLRRAAPAEPTILVVSDHGMSPTNTESPFPLHARGKAIRSGHHGHAPDGVIVAAGPGIRRTSRSGGLDGIARSDLPVVGSVFDVTPTLLALLGVPVGEDMDGTPMEGIIAERYLEERPITRVPTHDSPEWSMRHRGLDAGETDDSERLEQLRALGYLE